MKNSTFKRIMSTALCVMLLLAVVFTISSCKEEHVHDFSDENVVKATCTTEGEIVRTCDCGETEVEKIPALGHSLETVEGYAPTCTEDGLRAYEKCERCDYTTLSKEHTIPATGHTKGAEVVENNVDPTCTVDGGYDAVYYCDTCDAELERNFTVVTATGHSYDFVEAKAATCLPGWYEHHKCSKCGFVKEGADEIVIPAAYEHIESEHPVEVKDTRVDATCTVDGYYYEAICCTNDNCGIALTEQTKRILPALGHDIVKHEAQAPTCTLVGWEAHDTCSRCDYTTYVEIPELGHTGKPAVVEGRVEPTCTVDGEYYNVSYCEVCGEVASRDRVVLEAPGHDYVPHEGKPNSCTEIGWNDYNTCTKCDYTSYEEIPAHGHEEGEYNVENLVLPTCTEVGTYDRAFYCIHCEIELRREEWEVDPVAHNTLGVVDAKAPTCTEIGWEAYTCCSKCGYTETYVELPALGHELTKYEAKAPTCEGIGYEAYEVCANCDHNTYKEIPATGHNVVVLPAVKETCETNGLTEGKNCLYCDDVDVAQTVIPATGHNYGADGVCSNCNGYISIGLTVENGVLTGIGNCDDKDIVIPEGVVAIADGAFKNSKITSVVIADSVVSIGADAFFGCTNLESVVIGDGVEDIASHAFFYCTSLESITISGDVKSVGMNAFGYCKNLDTVNYCGTAAEWSKISIADGNDALTGADRKYI